MTPAGRIPTPARRGQTPTPARRPRAHHRSSSNPWGSPTIVWCGVVTFVILKLIEAVFGLRVSSEEETEGLDIRAGWVHLPHLPEVAALEPNLNAPSMSVETMATGLRAGIAAIGSHATDTEDPIPSRLQV